MYKKILLMIPIMGLLLLSASGCTLLALAGINRAPIDVEERTQECENGVATHHEERDLKKQRHMLNFTCFPSEEDDHYARP
jgi:hypothetical protein